MKVIEVKRSIFENNDKDAASLREQLKGEKTISLKTDVSREVARLYPGANGQ